jgi:hypothetical protein
VPDKDYSHRLLIDKLSIKPGARVAVVGVNDADFLSQLESRTPDYSMRLRAGCDAIVLGVESPADLRKIERCAAFIKPNGGLWLVYPKGRKDFKESVILGAGLAAGLVDNKVCSFSVTHTATRFVVRISDRQAKAPVPPAAGRTVKSRN